MSREAIMDVVEILDEEDKNEVEEIVNTEDDQEGYDYETMANSPSAELVCVICMKLMRQPVQFTCGHGMCNYCYRNLRIHSRRKKTKILCPQCRGEVRNVTQNHMLGRLILSTKVKCTRANLGCDWTSELDDVKNHTCEYEEVKCLNKNCDVLVQRRLLHQHLPKCNIEIIGTTSKEVKDLHNKLAGQNLEINLLHVQLQEYKERQESLESEIRLMRQRFSMMERSFYKYKDIQLQNPLNELHRLQAQTSASLDYVNNSQQMSDFNAGKPVSCIVENNNNFGSLYPNLMVPRPPLPPLFNYRIDGENR